MSSPRASSTRMRFGCCGSMVAPDRDPIGAETIEKLAGARFDYVELSLRDIAALPDRDRNALRARLQRAEIKCEACNNFFPSMIRLTGPSADQKAALDYAERALAHAADFGAEVVVFGSAGARNVPAGFPLDDAWAQLRALLDRLGAIAERHRITIAIEHLNRAESNIVNTVAEGARLMRDVGHPRVRLLADAYHILQENEDPALLTFLAADIVHVHIAAHAERVFPSAGNPALSAFFSALRAGGYRGRCSIEAFTRDLAADAERALPVCRALGRST